MHISKKKYDSDIQSHLSDTHIKIFMASNESNPSIPEKQLFQNLTLNSKVKVMGGVKCQSHILRHIVSLTSYRFMFLSFHVNRTMHSWNGAISRFDLQNPRSKSWGGVKGQGHIVDPIPYQFISLSFHFNWTIHSWDMAWHPEEAKTWCVN